MSTKEGEFKPDIPELVLKPGDLEKLIEFDSSLGRDISAFERPNPIFVNPFTNYTDLGLESSQQSDRAAQLINRLVPVHLAVGFLIRKLQEDGRVAIHALGPDKGSPVEVEILSRTNDQSRRIEWRAFYYAGLALMGTSMDNSIRDPARMEFDSFISQLGTCRLGLIRHVWR